MKIYTPEQKRKAYELGKQAANKGQFKVSPYYEDWVADEFWLGGFEGRDLRTIDAQVQYGPTIYAL